MSGAAGPPLPLVLLLLGGRAAFTVCRSLNAPQDGGILPVEVQMDDALSGVDRLRRPFLEKTRPFVLVDGQRRSLAEAVQDGHPDRLQCGLEVEGRLLLLDLEKNHNLLPKLPDIFFYLTNGTGVSAANPVTHCYYHGSVRGFPQSRVALSTCSGLRGVLVLNSSLSFELQPEDKEHLQHQEEDRAGGGEEEDVHLLFSTSPLEGTAAAGCGVSHTSTPPFLNWTHSRRTKRDILSETKYVELVLVADHQEFLNYQRNNKTIIYRMLDVANQVDWFYRPLNVRVALTGLEIWSDRDKIQVEKSPTDTLNKFLEWRTRDLLPRLRHDNAQLIMGESFDGTTVGMASQSSMCSRERSGGVNVDHLVSVLGVASTIAHELGHNLGMRHDSPERRCSCENEPRLGGCIMEPSTGFMPGQQFSSCSASDLSVSLLHGGGMCLFNVPQPDRLLGGPRCGNLYVEKGEECDCGLLEIGQECDDPCCNASTCQLVPGAQCSSYGICCEDCKLRAAGSVCREPLGECDLPEYCTGSSPYCPPNVFLQNGEACQNSASYCFGGVCANMDTQCQMLWGTNASSAPAVCFSSVNKQGNKYGNCGQLTNGSYVPCANSDVLCGRIQCQGGTERPLLGSIAQILTVRFNNSDLVCRGTFFHLDDDVSDPATVAKGTACGSGKACLNQKCQDVSVFGVDECRRKCSGHGVCNSNKNCHCDVGWAPPDCRYSGHGGSVDSGPARAAAESDPVRVALLVIFFFVLPMVLLFLALRFPRFRRTLCCLGPNSPFHKARQHNRTPVMERVDSRNGEQVRPLRYHLNPQSDIPLTSSQKEVHDRPAPPTKPLPPDPTLTPLQQLGQPRPAAPTKPLPPDPPTPSNQPQVSRPAPPNKPLPPDPVTPGQVSVPLKPIVPKKPRPPAPPTQLFLPPQTGYVSNSKPAALGAVAPAASPSRRPPLRPSRPPVPPKFESSPPL
ncbi:disintegrin and metalloproteinase domain-containing protein 15 isoform X3 [Girardinichthys multiradiatus]|uniref:disintegrin and metalloproteinase domain-containing protein 15 isoform X3 n=1 Tax=Girardinichthys multiradiatus TaxID=208333 RepID=UPI001FADAFC4|nr:disintegrin and metalloproteinase domain-containing protein 15 isoform X3 [Girardinichthys multiradiatus]